MNKYPASFIQHQFWLLQQRKLNSPAFNIPSEFIIKGLLIEERIKNAVQKIIDNEPQLRIVFEYRDAQLTQILSPHIQIPFQSIDLTETDKSSKQTTLENHRREIISKPFDLQKGPLFRCGLLKIEPNHHILIIVFHHTIADLFTMSLFTSKISKLYNNPGICENDCDTGYYIQYSEELYKLLKENSFEKALAFWESSLQDQSGYLNIPRSDDNFEYYKGSSFSIDIPEKLTQSLNEYAKENNLLIHIPLLTSYVVCLHKYSGQKDITTGYPFTNRITDSAGITLGSFANNLPFPVFVNPDMSFNQLTAATRKQMLLGNRFQNVPFEKIIKRLKPMQKKNINPIFQTAFTFEPEINLDLEECDCEYKSCFRGAPQLDLFAVFRNEKNTLKCRLEYADRCFTEHEIKDFSKNYLDLLESLLKDSDVPINLQKLSLNNYEAKLCTVISNYTIQPIEDILDFWKYKLSLHWHIEIGPYNQIFQELLNPQSSTNTRPGIRMIFLRLIDFGDKNELIEEQMEELLKALKRSLSLCPGSFYVFFTPSSLDGKSLLFSELEEQFKKEVNLLPGCHSFSSAMFNEVYPVNYCINQGDIVGHIPYRSEFYASIGTYATRICLAQFRKPYKVIVTDCDNTLWQGVVGEDGPRGVSIPPAFEFLQKFLLAQKKKGMVLALCSKNIEADVWSVFQENPDMILKKDDFTFYKINWNAKYSNLVHLANEINVNLDSFIYIDDNPVECSKMRSLLPQVLTVELPAESTEFKKFLSHIWAFDKINITYEDIKRVTSYQIEAKRLLMKDRYSTFGEFIKNLNLKIEIIQASSDDISRLSQLSYRTNQFNSSFIRMSEEELYGNLKNGNKDVIKISVSDRFGDYGIVGLLIISHSKADLVVENFILSCRVLGRGIEHKIMPYIGNIAEKLKKKKIEILVINKQRNLPFRQFIESCNGSIEESGDFLKHLLTPHQAAAIRFRPDMGDHFNQKMIANTTKPDVSFKGLKCDYNIDETIHFSSTPEYILRSLTKVNVSNGTNNRILASTDIEKKISNVWQEVLNIEEISVNHNFFDIGGNSILIPQIILNLKYKEKIDLQIVHIFQYPTIKSLAAFIEGKDAHHKLKDIEKKISVQKMALKNQKQKAELARMKNRKK